jgi:hypothetical protein
MDRNLKFGVIVALLASSGAVDAQTLVDPTRPAHSPVHTGKQAVTVQPMRVEAIISRGVHRVAIVDGQLVKAGDRLGNKLILEITRIGVRYASDGAERVARLERPHLSVRQTPGGTESTQ